MKRIIYGINPVKEALKGRAGEIEKIVVSKERSGPGDVLAAAAQNKVPVERLPRKEMDLLAGTTKHQGLMAFLGGGYRYAEIEDVIEVWKRSGEMAFFLVLDTIQDPQNMGSLIRTAHAAGVHGVVVPKDRTSSVTSTVVKASAGATEHTHIARVTNLAQAMERLKEEGVWVMGVETGFKEDIFTADLKRDLAIVIGSEGRGIRRLVRERCDFCVSIPMAGKVDSLNAAQAGAVALFEARRQRLK
jgi:23S rRNA (guanosine2251-2'-O)-methyltransferase